MRIFVGNLSPDVNDDQLKNMCESFGQVTEATVVRDPQGESKGFGLVDFIPNSPQDPDQGRPLPVNHPASSETR